MVMEAATLSGPQRKCNVVPAQKSLSLPSYARAGGEGIDHRIIFAELEHKEKVRRKSRIFTKEKTARQNIFCLPISSGSKCRETSLSSDTSCSSLEYQKPKAVSKPKKEESKKTVNSTENEPPPFDHKTVKTNQQETKTNTRQESLSRNVINGGCDHTQSLKINDRDKERHHSSVETFRLNVGSSDSMERSSRSSNDSLTRKERLTAIKARVEAEREKYGNSSSDEDSRSSITRYNSDGVIHRTVREVKSRSYRLEKRLRRRSQDEWALKRANRKKNNLSLCLNPEEDGIKLHLESISQMGQETRNMEVKTDYCPSPNFPDMPKKNYFSDFPSRENVTRFVQQRIKLLEEEERKRRSGSDFFDKLKSSRHSPLSQEKSIYASTEHVNILEKKTAPKDYILDKRTVGTEFVRRGSPIPRSSQAPTPPPRSPKSITFVNKAYLQHQNNTLHQENNPDKKKLFQPNIATVSSSKSIDNFNGKMDVVTRNSKLPYHLQSNSSTEKQQIRDLFTDRRKTCGNFDFLDQNVLNDLSSTRGTTGYSHLNLTSTCNSSSLTQVKGTDTTKGSLYGKETAFQPTSGDKNKSWLNKWEESEHRREFMFNSLESKKKSNALPWTKWKGSSNNLKEDFNEQINTQTPTLLSLENQIKFRTPSNSKWKILSEGTDTCICHLSPGCKQLCDCQNRRTNDTNKNDKELNKFSSNFNVFDTTEKFSQSSNLNWENITENVNTCLCCLVTGNKTTCECKNYEKTLSNNNFNVQHANLKTLEKNDISIENQFLSKTFNNVPANITNSKFYSPSQSTNSSNSNVANYKLKETLKSNDELKNNYSSDSSATANLENAMAELENVYRSLKFSSDTLSDKNSVSNLSLSDEDSKIFNKDNSLNSNSHSKRLSLRDCTDYVFESLSKDNSFNKAALLSNTTNSANALCNKVSIPNKDEFLQETSINELFDDLTSQLDTLENKLDHRDSKKLQQIDSQSQTKLELKPQINSSEIRAKKEFYENLNNQQNNSQKKKLKAVRSLSENISFLMASTYNNNKPKSETLLENNSQIDENTNGVNKLEKPVNSKHDEIRHIRVSMDTTKSRNSQLPVSSQTGTNQYSRLSSVVRSPPISPRSDMPKPIQYVASSNSKEAMDKTMDGLEELLSSLLSDVSETNQSSLSSSKDVPTTPPPSMSTGEMRVLQHLDVIRLKPVLS